LRERFGPDCRPFTSLGYAEATAVLTGQRTQSEAIAHAKQGHRNYAKRQRTWFRKEAELHPVHWLNGCGDHPEVIAAATELVEQHLTAAAAPPDRPPA
jgi:tRNA dimethylallyltransferase